jgi:hypothetical protein
MNDERERRGGVETLQYSTNKLSCEDNKNILSKLRQNESVKKKNKKKKLEDDMTMKIMMISHL